ncbi:hypothetical protein [Pleionea sp. CnH1-48]|uniref:hypothetical protein n=1 Tax=Pleionea sp. CnH1-48 TaxID=2954494 RepID=UPI002097C750|nr:hypothetical protein [Pleionea sp. CnH1-48]MCO7227403.1 hypothetical protein [Pleionea sp. CnH1-48]
MTSLVEHNLELLILLAAATGLLGVLYCIAAIKALFSLRLMRMSTRLIGMLVFAPLSLLCSGILVGIQGYHAFTQEEIIADIEVRPLSTQQFEAKIVFPDGQKKTYILEGDEIQIDASILKWKPLANFIGLSTHYELDRIAGRYRDIEQARNNPQSLYSLSEQRWLDIAELRTQYVILSPLVDAEYGSATFIAANEHQQYRLSISNTGLLVRRHQTTAAFP